MLGSSDEHSSPPPLDLLSPLQPPPTFTLHDLILTSSIPTSSSSLLHHPRQLLISCADLLSRSEFSSANRLLNLLSADFASPSGDSTERLIYYFSKALLLRLQTHFSLSSSSFIGYSPSSSSFYNPNPNPRAPPFRVTWNNISPTRYSSYLTLNQITPFIRFTHLTANQAILEAVDGYREIHILDMDIMHGVQWPPLLQAITERWANINRPPPLVRITGGGQDPTLLDKTGARLWNYAQTLGLDFHFQRLLIDSVDEVVNALCFPVNPGEALAVSCGDFLHRLLLESDSRPLRRFLHKVKTLNPRVFTLGETEADHNHPLFSRRFTEALDHYGAVFDSLEGTLPPQSQQRVAVEEGWFSHEIMEVIGEEGERRKERHQRFESWEAVLRSCGFRSLGLSPFSVSQAKLLLRLHYPSEGYQLQVLNTNCLLLGWKNRPLFSVSSWH